MAAAALATAAVQAAETPAQQAVAAFRGLCGTGELAPGAVLARADALGWRRGGADAPKDFDPAADRLSPKGTLPLELYVTSETSAGERRDVCGLGVTSPIPGLDAAVEAWLGFKPSFAMPPAATFLAVRTGEAWASGATVDRAAFAKLKAEGRYYSIMAADGGSGGQDQAPAMLMLLHVRRLSTADRAPAPPPRPPRPAR